MHPSHPHELRNLHRRDVLQARLEKAREERTTLSFYRYVRLSDVEALRNTLYTEWEPLGVFGRIYLAGEGINAQLSLPTAHLARFRAALDAREAFRNVPWKVAVEEDTSFLKLTIKVKQKLVADGLADDAFDVTNVGEHLDAQRFHAAMEQGALVVDMRNNYESVIGHFEGAYLPKADTFRGAIEEVKEALEGKEGAQVLLYCTGGIRCEKASAYLKHHGFSNVGQLHGGIIDYA
ncbi:MAG TPA: rhodanese-related sulfurtransferase, partial [Flavobacteriales bacterium]|nr:rhodanese-related sulfurtransferase [Flavobacteriales bacterium]